jgi:hypothetical protein
MLQIKDMSLMTLEEKVSYISKIQKELAVYKAQIEEVKNELKTLYPQGTPSTCVGYKVTVNYEFPVFETTKTQIGTKYHQTVTIK